MGAFQAAAFLAIRASSVVLAVPVALVATNQVWLEADRAAVAVAAAVVAAAEEEAAAATLQAALVAVEASAAAAADETAADEVPVEAEDAADRMRHLSAIAPGVPPIRSEPRCS